MGASESMEENNENTPLVRRSSNGSNGKTFYAVSSSVRSKEAAGYDSVRDNDGGQVVETLPEGAKEDDFAPRTLGSPVRRSVTEGKKTMNGETTTGFFGKLFGKSSTPVRTVKPRMAPIKIEPKVFFANERTFLAWMHVSIILAGASIAIMTLGVAEEEDDVDIKKKPYNPIARQLYGLITLPVAVAFLVYSMYQYMRRSYMMRHKLPGPYDDTVGPTVLTIMLMMSIVGQFCIKLFPMLRATAAAKASG